jgi:hypothetical protein
LRGALGGEIFKFANQSHKDALKNGFELMKPGGPAFMDCRRGSQIGRENASRALPVEATRVIPLW